MCDTDKPFPRFHEYDYLQTLLIVRSGIRARNLRNFQYACFSR